MKQSVITAFVIGLVCGIILWPLALLKAPGAWQTAQQQVCQIIDGGRWVARPGFCVKPDCYLDQTCGQRAVLTASVCKRVSVGDTLTKAYFELGEPLAIEGETLRWRWHKASEDGPTAVVEGERLTGFSCDPPDGLAQEEEGNGSIFGSFKMPFSDKRGNIID